MCLSPALFSGVRADISKADLSSVLTEEMEEEVRAAAEISMGTEVTALLWGLCSNVSLVLLRFLKMTETMSYSCVTRLVGVA